MRVFAFVRRGARVGVCVLSLGVVSAAAQESPGGSAVDTTKSAPSGPGSATEPAGKSAEPVNTQDPSQDAMQGAKALPELVVDGQKKKEKKTAKSKDKQTTSPSTSTESATTEAPPAGVTLGSAAPSDTGTATFDATNVQMRAKGNGDANGFLRNLPNVQYQNQASSNGGLSAQQIIDSKPAEVSISGGRTYENNFIVNGVSVNNILGSAESGGQPGDGTTHPLGNTMVGLSSQSIYVPAEFVGQATVIDSNASAEYSNFMGGVVIYDLAAPPTDRYHASVNFGRETSDYTHFMLVGPNTYNRDVPTFEKKNLAVSVGAPITNDFAFTVQASRKEAEATKPKSAQLGAGSIEENSDNIFLRFAATARTDIGKFTLDSSYTKYFQHWEQYQGRGVYKDTNTRSSSTKLEYDTKLAALREDAIGLGGVKLKARTYYNSTETQNNSGDSILYSWIKQRFYDSLGASFIPGATSGQQIFETTQNEDWCPGVDKNNWTTNPTLAEAQLYCNEGGYGNTLQGQDDYGVNAKLSGDIFLGNFLVGTELKRYEGNRARLEDARISSTGTAVYQAADGNYYTNGNVYSAPRQVSFSAFDCGGYALCNGEQYSNSYTLFRAYDVTAAVDAFHNYAEIDQSWLWFNARAGVSYDYDDYFQKHNVAPRLAATFKPFEWVSVTGGYNRYFAGESLYYAIRDKVPNSRNFSVTHKTDGSLNIPVEVAPTSFQYKTAGLNTPYKDEYSAAGVIKDPIFGGFIRGRYIERYGRDQFATEKCTGTNCFIATNEGWNFYRSASAEYTKAWSNLSTPFFLNAAAITGSVTWEQRKNSKNTYLLNNDLNGDGTEETRPIWYNEASYQKEEFTAYTGNMDIPIRFGATIETSWFNDVLTLGMHAGVNLGYEGVYNTGGTTRYEGVLHDVYFDREFRPTLLLDATGSIKVTEQASINFRVENITNSTQNAMMFSAVDNPWVIGRSYWIGSALNF